jgi:tetratricopeptide (TPR) repeat protein
MRFTQPFSLLAAVLICGLCIQPVLAISADEWVNSGNNLNQQGRYQEALQAFENAINLESGINMRGPGRSVHCLAWTGMMMPFLQRRQKVSADIHVSKMIVEM